MSCREKHAHCRIDSAVQVTSNPDFFGVAEALAVVEERDDVGVDAHDTKLLAIIWCKVADLREFGHHGLDYFLKFSGIGDDMCPPAE